MKKKLEKILSALLEYLRKEKPDKLLHTPKIRGMPTCGDRLIHMKNIGFYPRVIYDGGAFIGKWAKETAHIFHGAQLVIIEPNTSILP